MKATKRKTISFLLAAALLLAAVSAQAAYYQTSSRLNNTPLEKKALLGEKIAGSNCLGEQYDPNTNFYYLRARWYNPNNGRFTSVDPHYGNPQSPISLHGYLYGNASPVSFYDPSGRFSLSSVLAIGIILNTLSCSAIISSGDRCGVSQGWVQWSKGTLNLLRLDVHITFKQGNGYSHKCCEYRQKVYTVIYFHTGPSAGTIVDTRPLHDDNYSRKDDKDGNLNDPYFTTNDNPGLRSTSDMNSYFDYIFAAQQFVIDQCHFNKVVAKTTLHVAGVIGPYPPGFYDFGVPYIEYFH
jgi:RHS repeat-associated protein